ncbi:MAG: regulatory protein RecX [Dehalococcoidia bacterium]|nr:regulatory protein RecX [Dehalococcoidia bacterium]
MIEDTAFQHCLEAAYRYLSYRPRSEEEVRQRLHKHGFDGEAAEEVIFKLKEQNLIDDFAFAQFWKDDRLSFKPKSKNLINKELRGKGVAVEIIEQVTKDIDDEGNAYELGRNRVRALAHLNYPDFYRRLSGYLGYRGFTHEVIKRIITLLWQEKERC